VLQKEQVPVQALHSVRKSPEAQAAHFDLPAHFDPEPAALCWLPYRTSYCIPRRI